ncbi:hypothetical protein Syun_013414 [Stephania yunnanensis]|uniref:Late embryogenesis abundant protein LEA-2 subgroup domain-containing protein n=1 Tax=Stephania yunnanensis TaxID=152371 RepID=A0AAP0K224_9MAGN
MSPSSFTLLPLLLHFPLLPFTLFLVPPLLKKKKKEEEEEEEEENPIPKNGEAKQTPIRAHKPRIMHSRHNLPNLHRHGHPHSLLHTLQAQRPQNLSQRSETPELLNLQRHQQRRRGGAVVSFTFSLYAAVSNPNRAAVFNHYDSSLQLLYSGNQVGFMFVPAGRIAADHTVYISATFSVQSFPVNPSGFGVGPVLEMEARLRLAGRLQILHFFNHHVDARALCRVGVSATDGSVIGFRC